MKQFATRSSRVPAHPWSSRSRSNLATCEHCEWMVPER